MMETHKDMLARQRSGPIVTLVGVTIQFLFEARVHYNVCYVPYICHVWYAPTTLDG
jgi:hypothetical protein